MYCAETLRKVDQKYLESFKMFCWRGTKKIDWTDRVRNEVLHTDKKEGNILHTIKRSGANWIGHILRRNCLLNHVTEEKHKKGLKWRGDDEEDVSSYWMTLRIGENTRN